MNLKENSKVKIAVCIVLLCSIFFLISAYVCQNVEDSNNGKINTQHKNYLENPKISSCSNDASLPLQIRYVSEENIENYSITSSNENVLIDETTINISTYDGYKIYTFNLFLIVPEGEIEFDLKFDIENSEYYVKSIKNMNFNIPTEKSEKEFIFYSPFIEKDKKQEFRNDIKFKQVDLTGISFHILGEKILDSKLNDNNSVTIISENNTPSIVGYYYIQNKKKVCMFNAYHTEYLENK